MNIPLLIKIALMVLCAEFAYGSYVLQEGYDLEIVSPVTVVLSLIFIEMSDLHVRSGGTKMQRIGSILCVVAVVAASAALASLVIIPLLGDPLSGWFTFSYIIAIVALVNLVRSYLTTVRELIAKSALNT